MKKYEFKSEKKAQKKAHMCEHPGCKNEAEYRAPIDRTLKEYYWFCLEHVKEYNKNWNYYSGVSIADMEELYKFETLWDRPLNPFEKGGVKFTKQNFADYFNLFEFYNGSRKKTSANEAALTAEELDAIRCFELSASDIPFDKKELKKRYNQLAKLHHPDVAPNTKPSNSKFAQIASSYKILLKLAK